MSDETPRGALPLLAAAQAQKHITHNEALLKLDALLCARVLDRDLTTPPASPSDGDAYLVKATATADWTGQSGNIAFAVDGDWRFYEPFAGLSVFVIDESALVVYDGATWVDYAAIMVLQNVPLVGVNTSADATNKFAVKSSAVLFDNVGNGVQAKINKAASADSASLLYQKGYSGRAEIGLTGDDDFHFKVSPDGSTWYGALNIVRSNGNIYVNTASALESTSYPTTGTPQLQVKGHSVFGTSSSYPVRIHGDGYVGIEMSPNDSGGFSFNGYFNGTNVVYRSSSYAWRARFTSGGAYVEQYAASGTAGAAITFSTGRILTNAGHTLLNTSTDNGVLTVGGDVMPEADNTRSVGSSSFRFANGFFGGYVRTGSYVVSALPSAGTVGAGARAFVTDATATTFASTVAGGGANKVPVVSDGTNWIVG